VTREQLLLSVFTRLLDVCKSFNLKANWFKWLIEVRSMPGDMDVTASSESRPLKTGGRSSREGCYVDFQATDVVVAFVDDD
jgi:hypothetical protein